MLISHTILMNPKERAIRVKELCEKYGIKDAADRREAARIAAVREEDI